MKIRKLSAWSSYADNHAWSLIGNDLKEKTVEAIGDKAVDSQFGNVLGWLRDIGEHALSTEIRIAISEHNAQYECPECGGPLEYLQKTHEWFCGMHGTIRQD